ncbi:MAG: capsule assembly Wzi family protein [Sphingomonadales bacterium]|nr:capsule assembly Wzi family protein [Sphingomonadales bacterium]
MKFWFGAAVLAIVFSNVFLIDAAKARPPWITPNDRQLRQDVELLAAFGIVQGPVNQWPLSWAHITRGIDSMPQRAWPPHVEQALARVKRHIPAGSDYHGFNYEFEARGTNEERLVRSFGRGARAEGDARVSVDKLWDKTYVRLTVGGRNDPNDNDYHFDDSYIAQIVGNWVFYGGFIDQWWGPGFESGLMLTNNARPFPRVGIQRLDPKPFRTRWLRWLGPWQFNVFAGRLEGGRNDIDHPIVMGIRVSAKPFNAVEIGASRALQLCGEGRPCTAKTWGNALLGILDADNRGGPNEPGNQLAGVDIRYGTTIGETAVSFYGELIGEDEDGLLIDDISVLFGAHASGALLGDFGTWRLSTEFSDTKANRIIGSGPERGGITFNHGIYTDGYSFRGRTLSHSLDTDSRLLSIRATVSDARNRSVSLVYRHAELNDLSLINHKVSNTFESINMLEAESLIPTPYGDITFDVRVMDDRPDTPGTSDFNAAFEIGWKTQF